MTDARSAKIGSIKKALRTHPKVAFAMFSDPQYLEQWFFPPAVRVVKSDLSFQMGGSYLYGMAVPNRPPMWGRLDFRLIVKPHAIVFVQSVTDEDGRILAPFQGSEWLLKMKSEIGLANYSDGTIVRQTVSVIEASPEEQDFVRRTWPYLSPEYNAALDRLRAIFDQITQ